MLIAAVVALGAAVCFAGSSVLQSKAARCAPTAKLLRPGLLIDLLHRPRWLAGLAASVAGFGMQGLALHLGRLVLVQPLLLVELLFVVPFAGRAERGIASSARWITAGAIAGGLALFLTAARPRGGKPDVSVLTWVLLGGGIALCIGLCVRAAVHASRMPKTSLLATGAGVIFGLQAALLDSATYSLAHHGIFGTLATWQPYVLAIVAAVGETFAQSAYHLGPLSASVTFLYIAEPASAIAIGISAFGERITLSPSSLVLDVLGLASVVAGVVSLSLGTRSSAAVHREAG